MLFSRSHIQFSALRNRSWLPPPTMAFTSCMSICEVENQTMRVWPSATSSVTATPTLNGPEASPSSRSSVVAV